MSVTLAVAGTTVAVTTPSNAPLRLKSFAAVPEYVPCAAIVVEVCPASRPLVSHAFHATCTAKALALAMRSVVDVSAVCITRAKTKGSGDDCATGARV